MQLRNAIHSIEESDPNELSKRANKELAKALLTLSEREREREELLAKQNEVSDE